MSISFSNFPLPSPGPPAYKLGMVRKTILILAACLVLHDSQRPPITRWVGPIEWWIDPIVHVVIYGAAVAILIGPIFRMRGGNTAE